MNWFNAKHAGLPYSYSVEADIYNHKHVKKTDLVSSEFVFFFKLFFEFFESCGDFYWIFVPDSL